MYKETLKTSCRRKKEGQIYSPKPQALLDRKPCKRTDQTHSRASNTKTLKVQLLLKTPQLRTFLGIWSHREIKTQAFPAKREGFLFLWTREGYRLARGAENQEDEASMIDSEQREYVGMFFFLFFVFVVIFFFFCLNIYLIFCFVVLEVFRVSVTS